MRVLFSCTASDGHFMPLVPLARAFAERGDDVVFATAGFRERYAPFRARLEEIPFADRRPYAIVWRFAELDAGLHAVAPPDGTHVVAMRPATRGSDGRRRPRPDAFTALANVIVERYIPQGDVLPLADAVVCHGGSGSTLAALAHGLPLVLVPAGADQFDNAAACVAAGAAIELQPPGSGCNSRLTGCGPAADNGRMMRIAKAVTALGFAAALAALFGRRA